MCTQVVCVVYHAHITEAEQLKESDELDLKSFRDCTPWNAVPKVRSLSNRIPMSYANATERYHESPSVKDIIEFFMRIFRQGELEPDCIITALIYVERLIKKSQGKIRPHPLNWRSILLICLTLSSKGACVKGLTCRRVYF